MECEDCGAALTPKNRVELMSIGIMEHDIRLEKFMCKDCAGIVDPPEYKRPRGYSRYKCPKCYHYLYYNCCTELYYCKECNTLFYETFWYEMREINIIKAIERYEHIFFTRRKGLYNTLIDKYVTRNLEVCSDFCWMCQAFDNFLNCINDIENPIPDPFIGRWTRYWLGSFLRNLKDLNTALSE